MRKRNAKDKMLNDRAEQAETIPFGITVNGRIQANDLDYYRLDLKKGQQLNVEI